MSRIWRTDGPETKQLEKLFREKQINYNSKPQTVQSRYQVFKDFSGPVFRKNFNLAKQKCCARRKLFCVLYIFSLWVNNLWFCSADSSNDDEIPSLLDVINAEERESERIAELDGCQASPEKKAKIDNEAARKVKTLETELLPILANVYTNPETDSDVCMVVVLLHGGVKGVNIDVVPSADGPEQTLKIEYPWPKSMYDMSSMFYDDENEDMLYEVSSPRVQCIKSALKDCREKVENAPVAKMQLKLPIEVDTNPQTWTKTYNKKADGGVILYLEFNAIRKSYAIAKDEKFVKIE